MPDFAVYAMTLLFSIKHDSALLPYFYSYYAARGVKLFVCIVWGGPQNPQWEKISNYASKRNFVLLPWLCESFSAEADAEAQNIARKKFVPLESWYVVADLDEFHAFSSQQSFQEITTAADLDSAEIIYSDFIDRTAEDGVLPQNLNYDQPLGRQFPICCQITRNILEGCTQKVAIAKASMEISPGHHVSNGKPFHIWGKTHHFKWFGQVLLEQEIRLVEYDKQGRAYQIESERLLGHCRQNRNQINIALPELHAVRASCDPVANLFPEL